MVIERSRRRVKPAQELGKGEEEREERGGGAEAVKAPRGRMGGVLGTMRGFSPGEEAIRLVIGGWWSYVENWTTYVVEKYQVPGTWYFFCWGEGATEGRIERGEGRWKKGELSESGERERGGEGEGEKEKRGGGESERKRKRKKSIRESSTKNEKNRNKTKRLKKRKWLARKSNGKILRNEKKKIKKRKEKKKKEKKKRRKKKKGREDEKKKEKKEKNSAEE